MHRHFRMIGISEYLRCRGYDPDVYPHTRIPNIWKELEAEFNLDMINERDNSLDYVEVADYPKVYKEFQLPADTFYEDVMARVAEDAATTGTSPPQWDPDASSVGSPERPTETGKRKRADTATGNRSSSAESSPAPSSKRSAASPAPTRGKGGRKKAASKAKAQSTESEESEEEEEQENEASDENEEEEAEEEEASPAKAPRGGGRARGRARGRQRGRGRGRGRGG